jgi:hypothetical protein
MACRENTGFKTQFAAKALVFRFEFGLQANEYPKEQTLAFTKSRTLWQSKS